jgi:hypothetical protein
MDYYQTRQLNNGLRVISAQGTYYMDNYGKYETLEKLKEAKKKRERRADTLYYMFHFPRDHFFYLCNGGSVELFRERRFYVLRRVFACYCQAMMHQWYKPEGPLAQKIMNKYK